MCQIRKRFTDELLYRGCLRGQLGRAELLALLGNRKSRMSALLKACRQDFTIVSSFQLS